MSDLVLYTSEDGKTRLELRVEGATVWLTQLEIAELFQTTKQNVSLHAKNIFEDGELRANSVVKESLTTAADGKRYRTQLYNLDLILAIGYRIRSPRGTQFRQWATTHLKEFIIKGFVVDDERLKNPGGWDYSDELLARIREILASEKRFYQNVRYLFALSSDYQIRERDTKLFFAEVQNKLLYAATGVERILGIQKEVHWEGNQIDFKPTAWWGYFAREGGGVINGSQLLHTEPPTERLVSDPRELMAFVARPRSKAVGALAGVGGVINGGGVDLNSAPFGFAGGRAEHSAQFNWNIQRLNAFYEKLLESIPASP